jgi:hypothetical protein
MTEVNALHSSLIVIDEGIYEQAYNEISENKDLQAEKNRINLSQSSVELTNIMSRLCRMVDKINRETS